jgi:hypothetical protein
VLTGFVDIQRLGMMIINGQGESLVKENFSGSANPVEMHIRTTSIVTSVNRFMLIMVKMLISMVKNGSSVRNALNGSTPNVRLKMASKTWYNCSLKMKASAFSISVMDVDIKNMVEVPVDQYSRIIQLSRWKMILMTILMVIFMMNLSVIIIILIKKPYL